MLAYFDIDIFKLKYWERYYWKKANIVVAVSLPDEKIIRSEESSIKTTIIPNCVGDEMIVPILENKDLKNPIIFFQGNFFWLQNVEAAQEIINKIYPILIKENPKVNLVIAGQNAKKIGKVKDKNIKIIDIAPSDIDTVKRLFKEATLFIAPIFGPGGTRLKILAAMGSGIPVITTSTGVEGLDLKNNIHILIANNSTEFVKKIQNILKNKVLFDLIQKNAYDQVLKKYQWKTSAKTLETVYRNL